MKSNTETFEVHVNNSRLSVETAANNTTASPKQLLSRSGNHPGSYALFHDAYADSEDSPALLEERLGDRIELDSDLDVSEHQRFIAVLKRHL